jgi:hypothetical protein
MEFGYERSGFEFFFFRLGREEGQEMRHCWFIVEFY